jgi:hypothetical protein
MAPFDTLAPSEAPQPHVLPQGPATNPRRCRASMTRPARTARSAKLSLSLPASTLRVSRRLCPRADRCPHRLVDERALATERQRPNGFAENRRLDSRDFEHLIEALRLHQYLVQMPHLERLQQPALRRLASYGPVGNSR